MNASPDAHGERGAPVGASSPGPSAWLSPPVLRVNLVAGACLAVFLALCWFAWPQQDDFITPYLTREHGYWGGQLFFYRTWTGKFTATALVMLMGLGGDLAWWCPCLTAAVMAAFIAAAVALARSLLPGRRAAATALGLMMAALYAGSAVNCEGFYWVSSTCCYLIATVGIMAVAAWAWRSAALTLPRGRDLARSAAFLVAGFLIAGCNETTVPLAGIAFAVGWAWQWKAPRAWATWGAALAGLVAGTAVLLAAPGNLVRLGTLHTVHRDAATLAGADLGFVVQTLWTRCSSPMTICAAILVAPVAATVGRPPGGWWLVAGLLAIGAGGCAIAALAPLATMGLLEGHIENVLLWWLLAWTGMAWIAGCAMAGPRAAMVRVAGGVPTMPFMTLVALAALAAAGYCAAIGNRLWIACAMVALGVLAGVSAPRIAAGARAMVMAVFALYCLRDAGPDLVWHGPAYHAGWEARVAAMAAAHARGEVLAVVPRLPDDAYPASLVQTDLTGNPRFVENLHKARWYGVQEVWIDFGIPEGDPLRRTWEHQVRRRARALGQTTLGGQAIPDETPDDARRDASSPHTAP